MFPFPETKPHYLVRIFDNNHFIMQAKIPVKGQRYFTMIVQGKTLGIFGEEVKLAFMVNPEIPPKVKGNLFEIDFDIRDSTPMGDLLDIAPDLVCEINENYKKILQEREEQKKAEKKKTAEGKTIPVNEPPEEDLFAELGKTEQPQEKKDQVPVEKKDERSIGEKILSEAYSATKSGLKLSHALRELKEQTNPTYQKQLITECLDICQKYPKLLWWLPKHLGIDLEVKAVISQQFIWRFGIMPSYYFSQSNAPIVEKTFARPPEKPSLINAIVMIVALCGGFATIMFVLYLLLHRGS